MMFTENTKELMGLEKADAVSDDALVEAFVDGKAEMFDVLFARHQLRVRRIMGQFVRETHDVEDLVQEVFFRVWRALPGYRGDAKFTTWLHQIAVNVGINFCNRRKNDHLYVEEVEVMIEDGPERLCSLAQQQARVERAMLGLNDAQRQALTLNVLRGFDYADVGTLLNCPAGTVRSRISRARRHVAAAAAM